MIVSILWCLAAILDAFIDTLEQGHFQTSIFSKLNPRFWYRDESWKYAKKIFGYPIDAWHLGKSAMILCLAGALVTATFHMFPIRALNFMALGGMWIILFDLFYNAIFKRP